MILDKELLFDDSAAHLTTEASTNYVDLAAVRRLGNGRPIYFFAIVDTAFTDSSSNSTMTLTLETDDNTSFSSATTAQTVGTFAALSAIGTRLAVALQLDTINERYLRLKYTVANGDLTTGAFTAGLVLDVQLWDAYASGFSISGH